MIKSIIRKIKLKKYKKKEDKFKRDLLEAVDKGIKMWRYIEEENTHNSKSEYIDKYETYPVLRECYLCDMIRGKYRISEYPECQKVCPVNWGHSEYYNKYDIGCCNDNSPYKLWIHYVDTNPVLSAKYAHQVVLSLEYAKKGLLESTK